MLHNIIVLEQKTVWKWRIAHNMSILCCLSSNNHTRFFYVVQYDVSRFCYPYLLFFLSKFNQFRVGQILQTDNSTSYTVVLYCTAVVFNQYSTIRKRQKKANSVLKCHLGQGSKWAASKPIKSFAKDKQTWLLFCQFRLGSAKAAIKAGNRANPNTPIPQRTIFTQDCRQYIAPLHPITGHPASRPRKS